jgi:hypothetical protein
MRVPGQSQIAKARKYENTTPGDYDYFVLSRFRAFVIKNCGAFLAVHIRRCSKNARLHPTKPDDRIARCVCNPKLIDCGKELRAAEG